MLLRLSATTAAVLWTLFLVVDLKWGQVVAQAIADRNGSYGEWAGPLLYFRPVVFYAAFLATLLVAFLTFLTPRAGIHAVDSKKRT